MPFPKVCAYQRCSKAFVSVTSAKQFCSEPCMRLARKTRLVKQCINPECGKAFIAHRPPAKYCSSKCMGYVRQRIQKDMKPYLMARIQMPSSPEGCWLWTGHLNDAGYGMAANRGQKRAHRVVYETFVGPIPESMDLLHGSTCKTRACVNPFHVRIGTNDDNIQDRIEFGNHRQGSLITGATFTELQVLHILKDYHEKGLDILTIAANRGRPRQTINSIIYRRTWKHVAPGLYPSPKTRGPREPKTLAEVPHAVCGGVYCCCCGECLSCYGQDPCYTCEDRQHVIP